MRTRPVQLGDPRFLRRIGTLCSTERRKRLSTGASTRERKRHHCAALGGSGWECQLLTFFAWGWGGGYILDFSQSPNGEANDLNHTESQLVLQMGDDVEI